MKGKLKLLFVMCALLVGLSATAAAQGVYQRRNGRTVIVTQNGRRIYVRPNGRAVVRRPNGQSVVVVPNGRRVMRSVRSRQSYGGAYRGRTITYRLRNGRLVTVLPNGRRIYH